MNAKSPLIRLWFSMSIESILHWRFARIYRFLIFLIRSCFIKTSKLNITMASYFIESVIFVRAISSKQFLYKIDGMIFWATLKWWFFLKYYFVSQLLFRSTWENLTLILVQLVSSWATFTSKFRWYLIFSPNFIVFFIPKIGKWSQWFTNELCQILWIG